MPAYRKLADTHISLRPDQIERLKLAGQAERRPASEIIREAIDAFLTVTPPPTALAKHESNT